MELVERLLDGDRRALARTITMVENGDPSVPGILSALHSRQGGAFVVGLTGPPGAGKSTMGDKMILRWRQKGLSVGAILVDPSSPFTGGAILGDRIRMQRHALDPGVFIRSLGTRGSHGGLSRSTRQVMQLMDAFGMDMVVIETVGVGQTELDVMEVVDTTVVVLGPESGDTVQTMKAGLMEIADIFVVNKADREGADRMVHEIRVMIEIGQSNSDWTTPVLSCQANKELGIEELEQAVNYHRSYLEEHDLRELHQKTLRKAEFMEILSEHFRALLRDSACEGELEPYIQRVENLEISPYDAANEIFRSKILNKLLD